jgi:hypothetical protein
LKKNSEPNWQTWTLYLALNSSAWSVPIPYLVETRPSWQALTWHLNRVPVSCTPLLATAVKIGWSASPSTFLSCALVCPDRHWVIFDFEVKFQRTTWKIFSFWRIEAVLGV